MPKLNLGKVVGDKGDPFVFEDFTPEQLDGLTPKMLKGNVTTLDPDQNATVDIRKEGLNNYIDFGIPRGLNGSEIQSISAENVEMADGDTLEKAMAAANENIARIEEPIFDDTTDACNTLTEFNNAAEAASNAIQSHTSIFSTLSNMKKSLSAIVQGLKILGSNVGGIHGISSALDSQEEDIAASSKAVSVLNSNLINKQDVRTAINTSNIGSQSVNYANNAGNVSWNNVIGRPSIENAVTTVTTETKQIIINASSIISIDLPFISPIGFTAIGVIAVNANTASSAITRFMIVNNNVRVELRNITSGQQTITISASVLCKNNG